MAWSYNRLWHMLIEKKMKKTDLISVAGVNANAITRMGKGLPVSMENLAKICRTFHCELEDIVQYVADEDA